MAPEVIGNKHSKSPYNCLIDIWSLGITCIELAEQHPPLKEVHPLRALVQILVRDPPKLAEPDKWSDDFKNFIESCLQRDPE